MIFTYDTRTGKVKMFANNKNSYDNEFWSDFEYSPTPNEMKKIEQGGEMYVKNNSLVFLPTEEMQKSQNLANLKAKINALKDANVKDILTSLLDL